MTIGWCVLLRVGESSGERSRSNEWVETFNKGAEERRRKLAITHQQGEVDGFVVVAAAAAAAAAAIVDAVVVAAVVGIEAEIVAEHAARARGDHPLEGETGGSKGMDPTPLGQEQALAAAAAAGVAVVGGGAGPVRQRSAGTRPREVRVG
jgi:hypothetical protein